MLPGNKLLVLQLEVPTFHLLNRLLISCVKCRVSPMLMAINQLLARQNYAQLWLVFIAVGMELCWMHKQKSCP